LIFKLLDFTESMLQFPILADAFGDVTHESEQKSSFLQVDAAESYFDGKPGAIL
jgi:hypothetical protein